MKDKMKKKEEMHPDIKRFQFLFLMAFSVFGVFAVLAIIKVLVD